jgi:hypothetical protein
MPHGGLLLWGEWSADRTAGAVRAVMTPAGSAQRTAERDQRREARRGAPESNPLGTLTREMVVEAGFACDGKA